MSQQLTWFGAVVRSDAATFVQEWLRVGTLTPGNALTRTVGHAALAGARTRTPARSPYLPTVALLFGTVVVGDALAFV